MNYFSQKHPGWNPPWKTADEVFSEDFGKLLIKDLKYLYMHRHANEHSDEYSLSNADLGTAENLVTGKTYCGNNQLVLKMHTSQHRNTLPEYTIPVYVTEKQLKKAYPKAKILDKKDGAHITYYKTIYKDKNGNSISESQYKALSPAERKTVKVSRSEQSATVYNIDNTNFKKIEPTAYERLQEKFAVQAEARLKSVDASGIYIDPVIEKVMKNWLCNVIEDSSTQEAFYDPPANCVVIPSKERFMTGKTSQEKLLNGYRRITVLIHECMHSTGPKFGRQFGGKFGSRKYAREELVAETAALMVGTLLGLPPRILRNNELYLDGWLKARLSGPYFIKGVIEDARKASQEFIDVYNAEAKKLGRQPIVAPAARAETKKKPLINRVLAGIKKGIEKGIDCCFVVSGFAKECIYILSGMAQWAEKSAEKKAPAANARETIAGRTEASAAAAERTTRTAGTNRNGKADTGVSQLSPEDAEDRRIEQLIAQKCPTASRDNIEHIRNIIKQRLKAAKQQGGGLRIVDGKAQSLNERTNAHEKEQDRGPRTASRI